MLGEPHRPADDDAVGRDDLDAQTPRSARASSPLWRFDDRPVELRATRRHASSNPSQYVVDEVVIEDGSRRSAPSRSISVLLMPANSARSPLTRTGTVSICDGVPRPTSPRGVCGFLNRIKPASGSGLMETIRAPRCFAFFERGQHPRVIRAWILPDDE